MSDLTRQPVNRTLLIALAAVAALALLFVFVVNPLLLSDDGSDSSLAVAPATEQVTERPLVQAPTEEPTPEATPVPETFEVFSARDPFQQLVPEGSGTTTGGTTTGGTQTSGTQNGGNQTTQDDDDDQVAQADATVGGTTVRLVDVFAEDDGTQKVLVTVNGTGYEAGEGDVFAERFQVLDISGRCATFLFGDSRFVLCEGEEIRK